jgi:hypothetical protein
VLLDLLFESIDLLFNLLEQVFVCFSNRLVFGFVKAVFRSSLLLLQRLPGPSQLSKAALIGCGRFPSPWFFSRTEAGNQCCIGRIGLASLKLAVGISLIRLGLTTLTR